MPKMKEVLFFSRSGYQKIFANVSGSKIHSQHAVLNEIEEDKVRERGGRVVANFERAYESLPVSNFSETCLLNGFQPDRFLGETTLERRRVILGKLISFWEHALNENDIDAVVHETISLEPEEVLSIVAKDHQVDDMTFLDSVVDGYFYWKPNPYNSSFPQEMLERATPSAEEYQQARKHVEHILSEGHYPDYLDREDATYHPSRITTHLRDSLREGIRQLIHGPRPHEERLRDRLFYYNHYDQTGQSPFEKLIDTIHVRRGEYNALEDSERFVFYPLHVEPEATLRYFSPKFSNQLTVLNLIARFLPMNHHLVVKEHPSQPYHLLRRKYAQLRRQNSNVLFLPANVPSEQLIKQCEAVVTVSGTVGWEGAVYGRPVIVLGNVFYDKHPGVTRVDSIDGLRAALRGYTSDPVPPERSVDYLSRILAHSYPGRPGQRQEDEENRQKIRAALVDRLYEGSPPE